MGARWKRMCVVAAGSALLAPSVGFRPASAAAWAPPGFVRTIGGPGEAGVYAWGMEWNPVTLELLVGDYWNYQIRRYDLQGHEVGAFYRPASQRGGQPYTISVDDRNGDIYVAEIGSDTRSSEVARYDKAGNYLSQFKPSGGGYLAWTHDDGRWFYVASGHASTHPRIEKYDLDNGDALVATWGTPGTGPGQFGKELHGIDTDAAGNVYVADSDRRMVHVFTSTGTWLRDFGGPGSGVGQFTGDLRGLVIDRTNGWVYVVDAEAGQIEKFNLQGNPLGNWGSVGTGIGQYADGGREAAVDGSGHVWVADYGNFRFFEYDSNGTLLHTYPDPSEPPVDGHFAQVRDVAVDPASGNVWAADSWNDRFQEFGPTGAFLGTWGLRNSHPPYGMDYPRGIGVNPATGDVWVADTRESVIRVYDRSANYLFSVGSGITSGDPGSFRLPMDIEFFGGKVYVADYGQLYSGDPNATCRVKILDASTGTELTSIATCNNGLAIDPATGNLYVVSWLNDNVKEFNPAGTLVNTFGSAGTGDGQFQNAWDADIANGVLYVTDTLLQRVQAFTLGGTFLGKWGGIRGQHSGQFSGPSGITHDAAGRLYVADAGNDRISVFDPSKALTADTSKPVVKLTAPTAGQVLPALSPAMVRGSVTDTKAIGTVEVAVQNLATGGWWNAKVSVWQSQQAWNLASIVSTAPVSGTFEFGVVGIGRGGHYKALARGIDPWGNLSATPNPTVRFSTTS